MSTDERYLKFNNHIFFSGYTDDIILQFERNDEKRQFRIQEFIKTEKSYVETLKTLVKYVVQPLRLNMQDKHCVLNTFKCHKIFLNIDQITAINEQFLLDLQAAFEKDNVEFGALCEKHVK